MQPSCEVEHGGREQRVLIVQNTEPCFSVQHQVLAMIVAQADDLR